MNRRERIMHILSRMPMKGLTKGEAHATYKARVNKKRIPDIKSKPKKESKEFRNMSMEEYKNKYGDSVFGKLM